jgi:drug/metabolite transporter (DMT)-like permease
MTTIKTNAISGIAFAALMMIALMMASNHIGARIAFNHGLGVETAVVIRSLATALIVSMLIYFQKIPVRFTSKHKKALPIIAILITIQSMTIYASVARLPVSLALLAFNTYPLWAALWAKVFYNHRPERALLIAMPIMLIGLALALDVFGTASGLGAKSQWSAIGLGVAFAMIAAASFGMVLVYNQYKVNDLDGRLRTASTFWMVAIMSFIGTYTFSEFHFPTVWAGWAGLAVLTIMYGTAITAVFILLPRLGAVGNSAIMNVEPIFALILGWLILNQSVAFIQVIGALIVVGTVIKLGLRKTSK